MFEGAKAHMLGGSSAPEHTGEANFVLISYASIKQEKYEEFIDYIPFMNVRLQAASLKTFQSP